MWIGEINPSLFLKSIFRELNYIEKRSLKQLDFQIFTFPSDESSVYKS
jgi:hypothetical protein